MHLSAIFLDPRGKCVVIPGGGQGMVADLTQDFDLNAGQARVAQAGAAVTV